MLGGSHPAQSLQMFPQTSTPGGHPDQRPQLYFNKGQSDHSFGSLTGTTANPHGRDHIRTHDVDVLSPPKDSPFGRGSHLPNGDDVLARFNGIVSMELVGPDEFGLTSEKRFPSEVTKAFSRWPGAKWNAKLKHFCFPAELYEKIKQRLLAATASGSCRAEIPPAWLLVTSPCFKTYGQLTVPKKTADVLGASMQLPQEMLDPKTVAAICPEAMRGREGDCLMPYQRESIVFALRRGGRILLADEMGLGKTAQALVLAAQYPSDWPLLVICPSSLRGVWRDEGSRWLPSSIISEPTRDIQVIRKGSDELSPAARMFVVSYDLMKNAHLWASPAGVGFRIIICDEAHYVKSPDSQRAKSVCPLLKRARRCIMLSGTPALARSAELHVPLDVLLPGLMPSYESYCARYCEEKVLQIGRKQIKRYVGSKARAELNTLLQGTVMLRRLKRDVLTQLPPKRRQRVLLDKEKLDPQVMREIKDTMTDDPAKTIADLEKGASSVGGTSSAPALFMLTGRAKIAAVKEYVEYLIQADCRFLLFGHHRVMIDALEETLQKQKIRYIRIDGATPSIKRDELVAEFQRSEDVQVALLSTTACGQGLNLQCCSTVVFAEMHWTPGVLEQAEDRTHRIGQANAVNIHYLVAPGTLDENMYSMVDRKHKDVSVMLDGMQESLGASQVDHVGCFHTTAGFEVDVNPGGDSRSRALKSKRFSTGGEVDIAAQLHAKRSRPPIG